MEWGLGSGLGLARQAVPGQEFPLSMAARIAHLTLWVCRGQINAALLRETFEDPTKRQSRLT